MAQSALVRRGAGISPRRLPALLLAAAACCGTAKANPFTPQSDSVVLEHIPDARDPAGPRLRALHKALAADPANLGLAVQTAQADTAQARASGDPRYIGRADAALAPWPLGPATPPPVLLLRATMLQSTHQFDASQAALAQLLAAQPGNGQAWLIRAAVHLAQGQTSQARADCGQFATVAIGLLADSCVASVMAATGHAPAALRALTLSLDADPAAPPQARLWALTIAAETAAALGDPTAPSRFEAALKLDAADPYLLAVWSDWLLDHGRPADVVKLLSNYIRVDPLLLRLALAEQALGQEAAIAHTADLAARFDAAQARGETVHRREEARFRLYLQHDPASAMKLASANWSVQREPADARILLEAALAGGNLAIAAPVADWVRSTGLQDVRLSALLDRIASMEAGHGKV